MISKYPRCSTCFILCNLDEIVVPAASREVLTDYTIIVSDCNVADKSEYLYYG